MELPQGIETEEQLRAIIGEPSELVVSKIADRLNPLTRQFVERTLLLAERPGNRIADTLTKIL